MRSCPLVRATILETQGTVYRVSSPVGHTRIPRMAICCPPTDVPPSRETRIVRPSRLPETSLACRPSLRGSPIFSQSHRWTPLNASWGDSVTGIRLRVSRTRQTANSIVRRTLDRYGRCLNQPSPPGPRGNDRISGTIPHVASISTVSLALVRTTN